MQRLEDRPAVADCSDCKWSRRSQSLGQAALLVLWMLESNTQHFLPDHPLTCAVAGTSDVQVHHCSLATAAGIALHR